MSSELFAISADAHLLRGSLTPEECTCTFPDGRGASLAEARARLARVVCADPEQLGDGDIEAIAAAVEEAQIAAIAGALESRRWAGGRRRAGARRGRWCVPGARRRRALRAGGPSGCASPLAGEAGEVAAAVALSVLGRG